MTTSDGGKGSTQRPTNWDHFSENFDRIFGKKLKNMTEEDFNEALGVDAEDDICSGCSGSGEGKYDGSNCYKCGGSGIEPVEKEDDV